MRKVVGAEFGVVGAAGKRRPSRGKAAISAFAKRILRSKKNALLRKGKVTPALRRNLVPLEHCRRPPNTDIRRLLTHLLNDRFWPVGACGQGTELGSSLAWRTKKSGRELHADPVRARLSPRGRARCQVGIATFMSGSGWQFARAQGTQVPDAPVASVRTRSGVGGWLRSHDGRPAASPPAFADSACSSSPMGLLGTPARAISARAKQSDSDSCARL